LILSKETENKEECICPSLIRPQLGVGKMRYMLGEKQSLFSYIETNETRREQHE
jgi:hypothetical protein